MWQEYFPYTPRKGQVQLMEDIYGVIDNGGIGFLSAPTGVGKSVAVPSAALPFVEDGMKLVVIYRTRSQRDIYLKEIGEIAEKTGRTYSTVSLMSKDVMCPKLGGEGLTYEELLNECQALKRNTERGNGSSRRGICEYYLRNLTDTDVDALVTEFTLRNESPYNLVRLGREQGFCPHEALKAKIEDSDIFLGTYHYIFNPQIFQMMLRYLNPSQSILVVDEAHNLGEFVFEQNEDILGKKVLEWSLEEIKRYGGHRQHLSGRYIEHLVHELFENPNVLKERERVIREVGSSRRIRALTNRGLVEELHDENFVVHAEPDTDFVGEFMEFASDLMENMRTAGRRRSWTLRTARFMESYRDRKDSRSYGMWLLGVDGRSAFEMAPLESDIFIQPVLDGFDSAILMSGTLSPVKDFRNILYGAGNRATTCKEYPSPFPKENRLIIGARGISSESKRRNEEMFQDYAGFIDETIRTNKGNVAVFFTSYKLLEQIKPFVEEEITIEQKPRQDTRVDEVMEILDSRDDVTLFGVLGGKLSEGVDYKGERLTGVIVAGYPLAPWNAVVKARIERMEEKYPGRGEDYAYFLPAMIKAQQAAGRVHRSAEDRGCIILLDERMLDKSHLLPKHYRGEMNIVSGPEELEEKIREFWESKRS